ncbi:MAG: hypothetical protein GX139_06160 [Armatimonadetes bacterium]|nr:hypothetical protein [Armatimonadota bacterium]
MIEREAKLFEAGSYPDRGIEITEEDLDRIIANTSDAPLRIEHSSTPFDGALGVLKNVYRKGKELFGRLCFTKAAWELVKSANARRLSVAIVKDKSRISEVSLVREPRIADAAVFGEADCVRLDGELSSVFGSSDEALRREVAEKDAQIAIDQLKRSGKIAPAAEVFARAILCSQDSDTIAFADRPTPISQVFRWFLESQPKVIEFSEVAPAAGEVEEPELYAKLGVTSGLVEKYRSR